MNRPRAFKMDDLYFPLMTHAPVELVLEILDQVECVPKESISIRSLVATMKSLPFYSYSSIRQLHLQSEK